jgi:hypothetical protein
MTQALSKLNPKLFRMALKAYAEERNAMRKGFILSGRVGTVIVHLMALLSLFAACQSLRSRSHFTREGFDPMYRYGIDPNKIPDYVTDETFPRAPEGEMGGLAGKDLREKDLSRLSADFLSRQTFDQNTRWPEENKLPRGFSPIAWLARGKDPGLGIKDIHKQGVTGKGVSVAVIDKPIFAGHQEFEGRIVYRRIAPEVKRNSFLHFHGISCASILAGSTCGVAPEATIYYFATPDTARRFYYYSLALDELVKVNESLPPKNKIRIVSISDGISREDRDWPTWESAVKKAEASGVKVLCSTSTALKGFVWGGCRPDKDRGSPSNYDIALYWLDRIQRSQSSEEEKGLLYANIIIPGDFRTTSSNMAEDTYIYWGKGGFSWAIPYVAGLAGLAWEIKPTMKFEEIIEVLKSTKDVNEDGKKVINPRAFIKAVRSSVP